MKNLKKENVTNFIEGYFNLFKSKIFNKSIEPHIKEMVIYRAVQCEPCLLMGECSQCGCSTPAMFFSSKKKCDKGRWGAMVSKEDWETFKLENNIEMPEDLNKELENIFKRNIDGRFTK